MLLKSIPRTAGAALPLPLSMVRTAILANKIDLILRFGHTKRTFGVSTRRCTFRVLGLQILLGAR